MTEVINELDYLVSWQMVDDGCGKETEVPYPRPGLDESFDNAHRIADEYKEKILKYLEVIKELFRKKHIGNAAMLKHVKKIKYVNSKLKYEIEVPSELVKGNLKPDKFVLVSTKIGFERFHT